MLMAPARARPILKWAGGKTQLLDELLSRAPTNYGKYIEPFIGGGALFFALKPRDSVIADSNPELINLYKQVAQNLDNVVSHLSGWRNTESDFYRARKLGWDELTPAAAAARTLFLNKTCFNGLYRVNRRGEFNVPFGRYTNPKIVDLDTLKAASLALKDAKIICADFQETLKGARKGDFVFLDPPYVPVSEFADFKRYTKDQFREEQHRLLASEVDRLVDIGCFVVATNSDAPLVHELYSKLEKRVLKTKRHISRNGSQRTGSDVIIWSAPKQSKIRVKDKDRIEAQIETYPSTRFMGSKSKLLGEIWSATKNLRFDTVVDLFSGSGTVGYMFKCHGKSVISNDQMAMACVAATAMIENSHVTLPEETARSLLLPGKEIDNFVRKTFGGLYFSPDDELTIDVIRTNIPRITDRYQQAIAVSALIRACMKKRARGIFTFTGMRYDDGRKDLKLSLSDQFIDAVRAINAAIFDNGRTCKAYQGDALGLEFPEGALIYMDPPYWSPLSDNEYVRRYHFVEGLARNWEGVEIQRETKTKKFRSYVTPFRTKSGTHEAFEALMHRAKKNPIVISYSSNGEPTVREFLRLLARHKKNYKVVPIDHTYSFGNQGHKKGDIRNRVSEYLFIGY